jgi:chromate transport protein ChrA
VILDTLGTGITVLQAPVPLPGTVLLLAAGLLGWRLTRRQGQRGSAREYPAP